MLFASFACQTSGGGDDDRPPVSDDDDDDDDSDTDDDSDDDSGDDDTGEDLDFQGLAVGGTVDGMAVIATLTEDGWSEVVLPDALTGVSLFSCEIPEPNRAWIVGEDTVNKQGKILYYNGTQWRDVTPPGLDADWYLRGLDVIDPSHAWAVGYDRTNARGVMMNYDSGVWNYIWPQYIPANWTVSDVQFPSPLEGYMVGQRLIDNEHYTGNLVVYLWGEWQIVAPLYFVDKWYLTSVYFADTLNGWVGGRDVTNNKPILMRYWNGSWAAHEPPEVNGGWWVQDIDCIDAATCTAVGTNVSAHEGVILFSNVEGNWSVWNTGELLHRQIWDLWAVEYDPNEEVWYAVGSVGASDQGGLVIANDGTGWRQQATPNLASPYYFIDICMTPALSAQ